MCAHFRTQMGNTSDPGAAYENITRSTINADKSAGGLSLQDFAIRSTDRIQEIQQQRAGFLSEEIPAKEEFRGQGFNYPASISVCVGWLFIFVWV